MSKIHASTLGARPRPVMYRSSLQPMMQDLLRELADIDFEHDAALDRLEGSTDDPYLKGLLAERLRANHHARREPYLRRLADLQAQATRRTGLRRFI